MLLAALGLPWLVKRDRLLGWIAVVTLFLALYVNAAAVMWWGGHGFGGRRFVSYMPFLVVALSAFLTSPALVSRTALVRTVSIFLIGSNLLFLLQYQLFMRGFHDIVPEYPESLWTVFGERFVVPFKLVAAWLNSRRAPLAALGLPSDRLRVPRSCNLLFRTSSSCADSTTSFPSTLRVSGLYGSSYPSSSWRPG